MVEPQIGDFVIIGGAGAYCSSMSPYNYNSHPQAPEVLFTKKGKLVEIRKRQTLEQMLENEV
jgi:diaminopimelate decarboxylase